MTYVQKGVLVRLDSFLVSSLIEVVFAVIIKSSTSVCARSRSRLSFFVTLRSVFTYLGLLNDRAGVTRTYAA